MKLAFLIHNIYGIGGTNRTVINLAEALASRHDVRIVSVFRRDAPMFDISSKVRVTSLVDLRKGQPDVANPALAQPSVLIPSDEEFHGQYSALTDARIAQFLSRADVDVIIGTRPGLNLCVARYGRESTIRVTQEHMTHDLIPPLLRAHMREAYTCVDAAVTLTDADARLFATMTPVPGLRIETIPNCVPLPAVRPADSTIKTVIAAGRLDPIKRYDLLVHAFARVAEARPDWHLRIYGGGPDAAPLRQLIQDLGLHNHVLLMGRAPQTDTEWVKGSLAASSSTRESFGMTIVEAMRAGLPVVSTDCPSGPREIINDGVDGFLVPVNDVNALAGRMLTLINDDQLRQRMGVAARNSAARFDSRIVANAYDDLIERLAQMSRPGGMGKTWRHRFGREQLVRPIARTLTRNRMSRAPAIDCVVAANGTIDVSACAGLRWTNPTLEFRSRDGTDGPTTIRVPLTAVGGRSIGQLAARDLTEGRWNAYIERGRATVRATPGLLDLREALAKPATTGGTLVRALPYRTADGFLAIRAWVREIHFELSTIEYEMDALSVTGRLYGAHARTGLTLRAERRGSATASTVTPGCEDANGTVRFKVPVRELVDLRLSRRDDWDLYVATADAEALVPIARLLDDVVERRRTLVYPAMGVTDNCPVEFAGEWPINSIRVRPYLTMASHLALAVSEDSR